jgi:hypothetical protein
VRRVTLRETLKKSMASHVQASQPANVSLSAQRRLVGDAVVVVRTSQEQSPLCPGDRGEDLKEGSSALSLLPVRHKGGEEARGHGGWKRKREEPRLLGKPLKGIELVVFIHTPK